MSLRAITYKVCDRCKRETPATCSRNFLWYGLRYEIDLCEKHDGDLHHALDEWTSVATCLTQRYDAPLPSPTASPAPPVVTPPTGPEKQWLLTAHALTRCEERQVDPDIARRVAQAPEWSAPSARGMGYAEHVGEGVVVVVAPEERAIITVYRQEQEAVVGHYH